MRRVSIPCDVQSVKIKVMLNMTKRQMICFSMGAAIGLPLFFLTKDNLGVSGALMVMMVVMLPAFFFAMYEKRGQTCEVLLQNFIRATFIRPKFRPNRSINIYTYLQVQEEYRKEEARIVQMAEAREKQAKVSRGGKADKGRKKAV